MALELPALCSDFSGGRWEEPGDAIQVTWGIRGFPVKVLNISNFVICSVSVRHHTLLVYEGHHCDHGLPLSFWAILGY